MSDSSPTNASKRTEDIVSWILFTLFLPLLPILMRVIVFVFGKGTEPINILDSAELLYYSFIVCIDIISGFISKKNKLVADCIIFFAAVMVAMSCIGMLFMVYINYQRGKWILWASIIVTVLMIIAACVSKWREGE